MQHESLGATLRRLRLSADMTLERLADLSTVSDRTISDIERGVSTGPQRRTIELLADALGLELGARAELTAAARAGRTRTPSPAPPGAVPLPRAVADFTGRARELDLLGEHLGRGAPEAPSPVAVISGPPGFGKTTLAVQLATDQHGRFEDVYFVDLRGYDARPLDASTVLNRLIHALDPQTGAAPSALEDAAALWDRVTRRRKALIVLDNAASEEQVRPVIPATGPTAVLVTSRGTLSGLEDVLRVPLGTLSPSDAVAMLGQIVPHPQSAGSDLDRLASLCGHVPLALRIAGNRVASRPSWTVDDLAARLRAEDRRIDGLRAGDLRIRNAIALSYDRLSDDGRTIFRRLSLLGGATFSVPVAARLAGTDLATAEDLLDELEDLGLVQPAVQGRYHLHDLLRLFARDRFHDDEPVERRVAVEIDLRRWLLALTIQAGRWFEPEYGYAPADPDALVDLSSSDRAQAWIRAEAELWLRALQDSARVGEHQRVVDVAESLHWFSDLWVFWGHWHDVFDMGTRSARALGDDQALATQLGYLAWAEMFTRAEPERGLACALEASEAAARAGDTRQAGWAATYASLAYRLGGRLEEALRSAREAERLLLAAGDAEGHLQARRSVAVTLGVMGRREEAIEHERRVLADLDDPACAVTSHIAAYTRAASVITTASHLAKLERWDEAIVSAEHALLLLETVNTVDFLMRALRIRIGALVVRGRIEEARADQARLVDVCESVGDVAGAEQARSLV
ncbi:helix-turn-helix domain-containing protein [Isoptericola sp. NPDC057191]|uniref:helix-turn-helix domain-containing protein n=1 Tax=Isoptericola sp. NPDC057191 TaxID=3346041 RepID=UPI003643CF01